MATTIDPAALSLGEAIALREYELAQLETARCAAGMAKGAARRRYLGYARQHHGNVMALANRIDGPMPASLATMSTDELFAALSES
jgi:hypothetical protein